MSENDYQQIRTHHVPDENSQVSVSRVRRVVLPLIIGLGECFLAFVVCGLLLLFYEIPFSPHLLWDEYAPKVGFVFQAIALLAFPVYNLARREWLLMAGNVLGIVLLSLGFFWAALVWGLSHMP